MKSITEDVPKDQSPIERMRLSYDRNKKPTKEELEKLNLVVVEDYAKGSFYVVKPKVPIALLLLSSLEDASKVTFVAPVMRIKAIVPPGKSPPASRG